MHQLTLNFDRCAVLNGKKTKRLTTTCSEEFEGLLDQVVNLTGADRSKLIHRLNSIRAPVLG